MTYLGKYARIGNAREIVWDILRNEEDYAKHPFTMREFYERNKMQLQISLSSLKPGASVEGMVRGTLQSLNKKGLINAFKVNGGMYFSINIYQAESTLIKYSYGRAMIEAQRLHLL